MRIYAPEYYKNFQCIADKCRHNCCIGWEIDIDANTLENYKSVTSEFGNRLRNSITYEADSAHFTLDNNERCPFLNSQNLCDIIAVLGEDSLCEICDAHPRFKNFYSSFTEIGLGLCCEAVGEIILNYKPKFRLEELSIENEVITQILDEEQVFLNLRERIISILQNREIRLEERLIELFHLCSFSEDFFKPSDWLEEYLKLEHLNTKWCDILKTTLKSASNKINLGLEWDTPFEQLLIYFIYRHTADGLYDGMFRERIAFSVLSFNVIRSIFANLLNFENQLNSNSQMELLIEISRLYSSEIEYCEENTEKLLDILYDKL